MPTIQASSVSQPIYVASGSIVTVAPQAGATAAVEYTIDCQAAIVNGVAQWSAWPSGTVSVATSDLMNDSGYVRVTAQGGSVDLTVDGSPSAQRLAGFRADWGVTGAGPQGPKGDIGPQGPQGPQGPAGPAGSGGTGSGVDPTDVGFDIVLLAGQSNMAGRGTLDGLVDVTHSRVFQFGDASADTTTYRKITLAQDPMPHIEGVQAGQMGLGTHFGRGYSATIPPNRFVLLIPVAMGSTALVGSSWAAGSPGGSLYENAITQANLAITAAKAIYPASRFVGTLWAQGEQDANNGVSQATYAAGLKAVIAGFRSRITGATGSWFVINGMVPEYVTANNASYGPIQLALQQVATETDKCTFVAGPTGQNVGVHYNAAGYRIMGARDALAVQVAAAYSTSDTTPPVAGSASVANASPTLVSIAMSESLDAAYVPATSAFVVTGHTVSAVAVSGTTVSLTVTPAFVNGETRTVSYTQPGSNGVRDVAGNLLASFSGLSITDNVAAPASAVTLSGPSSGTVNTASSNFSAGVSPVGGAITGTVTVTPSDGGAGGSFSPASVNLTNAQPTATFTYTPTSTGARTVSVSNNGSLANPSGITYTSNASATVPDAPTIGTATAGDATVSVAFTAPGNNGGAAITGYTAALYKVSDNTAAGTATGSASPIAVTAVNGVAVYAKVKATNSVGTGAESAASNNVTPQAAVSYATWNPADKQTNLILSNANLTVTGTTSTPGNFESVRGTLSKSAGKWYFEVTAGVAPVLVGVGTASATLANFVGNDANGVGYYNSSGTIYKGNTSQATGATYTTGDVIGVALDMDAKTVTFYKNGTLQGSAVSISSMTGSVYPMGTTKDGSPAGAFTANFGASAFAYTPPAGHVGLQ